ncbi:MULTISPECIES: hypothetical protein [unclassified Arthrobacter]|uniref:hypothetical protein n=1 Tax=unclassified Arthrobacter TaxID=235627 RepID=UPI001DBDB440|nr:hypothetical protein [Arthrobacter sp. Bi26]CAH0192430.1 hypothetical protein SRABI26_01711 [Arthrobacter sp. Bi26]
MTTYPHAPGPKQETPQKPEPISNWYKLSRYDYVEIYRQGEIIAQGNIDMLALDGSVLWLHQDEGKGRLMFLQDEGLRVYKRPHAGHTAKPPAKNRVRNDLATLYNCQTEL